MLKWFPFDAGNIFFQNEDHNGERDIMKEFVDQSFERERKRQQERESKKAEREAERDIIKEFVDQSFELFLAALHMTQDFQFTFF